MNITFLILVFVVMVGVNFCIPNANKEGSTDALVARNPFGCLLNIIGLITGFLSLIASAIYFSITWKWWFFLLFIPAFYIASIVQRLLSKLLGLEKDHEQETNDSIAQVLNKKILGSFLVITSWVFYFVWKML